MFEIRAIGPIAMNQKLCLLLFPSKSQLTLSRKVQQVLQLEVFRSSGFGCKSQKNFKKAFSVIFSEADISELILNPHLIAIRFQEQEHRSKFLPQHV
jgi:hypothetical protein